MQKETLLEVVNDRLRTVNKALEQFKQLKKLKQAIETIGKFEARSIDQIISSNIEEAKCVIVFFFGAGTEKDELMLKQTSRQCETAHILLVPGTPYGAITFQDNIHKIRFLQGCTAIEGVVHYRLIRLQREERIVFYFPISLEAIQLKLSQRLNIGDCLSVSQLQPISGLFIRNNFVNEQEQMQLAHLIDQQKWIRLSNRKVQHYGYEFKYGVNSIDKEIHYNPIPQFMSGILDRLHSSGVSPHQLNQLTINCYDPGDGIPSHFDTHSPFEEVFVSLSLLGNIVMEFQSYAQQQRQVLLQRRSLVIFSGEARYAWKHAISPRKMDRIDGHVVWRKRRLSLTFRAIRHHPCSCPYYFFCDSQGYDQEKMKKHNPLLKKYIASKSKNTIVDMPPKAIEKEYVEKAYNSFGYTFSNPLHPKVLLFIESIPSGSLVLDIGCGNGVYLELIEKLGSLSLGIERCTVMGNTSIGHYEQRVLCDALRMPCKDGMFDYLLAIAVWHHFASEQSRKRLLQEIARVMSVSGKAMISVFAFETQEIYSQKDILMDFSLPIHRKKLTNQDNIQQNVYKGGSKQVYKRYYHLFSRPEIQSLVTSVQGLKILSIEDEFSNYYVTLQRI